MNTSEAHRRAARSVGAPRPPVVVTGSHPRVRAGAGQPARRRRRAGRRVRPVRRTRARRWRPSCARPVARRCGRPATSPSPSRSTRLLQAAVDAFGGVDVWINNAAYETPGMARVLDFPDPAMWERTTAVNVVGTGRCTLVALAHMVEARRRRHRQRHSAAATTAVPRRSPRPTARARPGSARSPARCTRSTPTAASTSSASTRAS